MIRSDAARAIAADILGPLVPAGDKTETLIDLAASLIVNAVKADELQQQIDELEARPPKEAA